MILSLDPGSSKIGWAITCMSCGTPVKYGLLSPIGEVTKKLPFNLKMNLLIRRLIPQFTSILEEVYHCSKQDSMSSVDYVAWEIVPSFGTMAHRELVQATAITLKILTLQKELPYQQFSPQGWHKQLLGQAKVTKDEVKSWVSENNTLLLDVKMTYDVYDAIAIGQIAYRQNEWITDELL